MKLLFLSNVYLLISSVFSTCCIGVLSGIFTEVKTVELIIFTIGTYWFNIALIIESIMILIKCRR